MLTAWHNLRAFHALCTTQGKQSENVGPALPVPSIGPGLGLGCQRPPGVWRLRGQPEGGAEGPVADRAEEVRSLRLGGLDGLSGRRGCARFIITACPERIGRDFGSPNSRKVWLIACVRAPGPLTPDSAVGGPNAVAVLPPWASSPSPRNHPRHVLEASDLSPIGFHRCELRECLVGF